jgi:molecular chaperone HtpG
MQSGNISVHTQNIFPIIKKFLYTDHEIFIRELVSNSVDATQKLKIYASKGDVVLPESLQIKVAFDADAKTITISDNGIGMNAEEIEKYINQIAFSGAEEFLEKFKDDKDPAAIIGHFGMGFYSSFMVADKVEIQTLSYRKDEEPAHWICEGSTEFTLDKGTRTTHGTDIIMHINNESEEFLNEYKIKSLLEKYCKYLPIEITFKDEVINNINPLWKKNPVDLKDEDYITFYKELYPMESDPLFWIHLNVDYPFTLTGILFFPKVKPDVEPFKKRIQLYCNQVFVTDQVEQVVPDFLMLLRGVIDSPDIPLNVSRSALQADGNVKKITSHISKKVADKLGEIFKKERESYENKWDGISLFVKYGMLSDEKFAEKATSFVLLKNTDNKLFTFEEYETLVKPNQTDKDNKVNYLYANNADTQFQNIENAKEKGYDVLLLNEMIDVHFVSLLEQKLNDSLFKRVDSEASDKLIDKGEVRETLLSKKHLKALETVFESEINKEKYTVQTIPMAASDPFISVTKPEWERRMKEMEAMRGPEMSFMGSMPDKYQVMVNSNHPLASVIAEEKNKDARNEMVNQSFDLALLSQNMLTGAALSAFIKRSSELLSKKS